MRRDRLSLSQHQFIETSRDHNGRYFIAYSGGASVLIRDVAELRRFLKIPKGILMRESLDSWLASLADQDAKRKTSPNQEQVGSSLSDEVLATGFGPECHLDPSDPNHNTRAII
jgi:hypothetical protein